ncbi:hypothetical protein TSUD_33620, partial [Trifolium subterraneum]
LARAHAKGFGESLSIVEKNLSSETEALKDSQAKVAQLEEYLKGARKEEETLKGKVANLEEKLASRTLTPVINEEERRLDPEGTYAQFSRADLIARIYQIGDLQLEVVSLSFRNALAQLQVLNPDIQLVTDGMDELKEVQDSHIATPPPEEEWFNFIFMFVTFGAGVMLALAFSLFGACSPFCNIMTIAA